MGIKKNLSMGHEFHKFQVLRKKSLDIRLWARKIKSNHRLKLIKSLYQARSMIDGVETLIPKMELHMIP